MKGLDIPERFAGTIYIYMWSNPSDVMYGTMGFGSSDVSDWDEAILLASVDVDVPLNSAGTIDKQIAQLQGAKQKIINEATEKAGQIDEAIKSLLAIEHKA